MSSLVENSARAPDRGRNAAPDSSEPPLHVQQRAPLRLWATLDVLYSGLVALLAIRFIPWRLPIANVALLVYAALLAVGVFWLWRGQRFGLWLALVTSLTGVVAAVFVVAGLVGSWAYLRAIHGAFGQGASVVALFLAACAFQILGLYPALRLRALLRAEVWAVIRGHPVTKICRGGARTSRVLLLLVLAAPFVFPAAIHARFTLHPDEPLPRAAAQAVLAHLRAYLLDPSAQSEHALARTLDAALDGRPLGAGPVYVQLYVDGRPVARTAGGSWQRAAVASLADALAEATHRLTDLPGVRASLTRGRLKLDRVVADGPVATTPQFVLAFSVDPGRDGLRSADHTTGDAVLLPDDMLRADSYGAAPLLPFLDEVRLGVDAAWLRAALGHPRQPNWRRFRTESWIECTEGACPVERGRVVRLARPEPAQAARAAGEFILRMQDTDGRFFYQYFPYSDATPAGAYNLPRHAGTAYSLALWAAATDTPQAGLAADRALRWLANLVEPSCGPDPRVRCVIEPGSRRSTVGVNALFLIALCERLAQTPDHEQHTLARGLAEHLLALQKSSGDFFHVYLPDEGRIDREARPHMFASEEAAFALVKAGQVLHDERFLVGAERALDYLTGTATGQKYDHFLGRFTFGVDSWTCMAAEAGHDTQRPGLRKRAYLDFCLGYADFLRRLQFAPGEAALDFEGHYGFSAVMVPQAPAAAGFAEALGAVAGLAQRHGADTRRLDRDLERALEALARDQLDDDNAYLAPAPARARGGIRRSLVQSEIRIDFVQHALAALLRSTRR